MNNIIDIIEKKKNKQELNKEEIEYFVTGYTNNEIPDYQSAALVMAICINGMTKEETVNLTIAMANSGDMLDLSEISSNTVDKHSTGGVGDKITLILMPILSSVGIPVAKMSGRGLGFTGGTADKLESIPGYNTGISIEEFKENVKEIGISLITQTLNLAPADKKIYALRDTIACTNSMPLIASSIMSKKIAAGAKKLLLDVTCGSGAFMQNKKDAEELSRLMIDIGKLAGIETVCIITDMDEPVGYAVGNTLEVKEAIECLNGNMPEDVKQIVLTCGAYMMKLAGINDDLENNKVKIIEVIENGKALEKFKQLVKKQGGDISYIEDLSKFENAKYILPLKAEKSGYIYRIDAKTIGEVAVHLGAGRQKKEDAIDFSVGIVLKKKVSENVAKDEDLLYIYANDKEKAEEALVKAKEAYEIKEEKYQEIINPILEIIE